MKKVATLLLFVVVSCSVMAQQKSDSFFNYDTYSESRIDTRVLPVETLGTSFSDMNVNVDAPIGNGMFILVAVGFIYTMLKKKEVTR
jgi:hypothetical protein